MKRVQEIVQSMFRMLNSAIAGIYGLMMIFIVICCIFFAHIRYWTLSYSENFLPAIVLLIFGGITICGIVTICKRADRECKTYNFLDSCSGNDIFNADIFCVELLCVYRLGCGFSSRTC